MLTGSMPNRRASAIACSMDGTLNVRWWGPGPLWARNRARKSFTPVSQGMSTSTRAPLANRNWPGAKPGPGPPEAHDAPRSVA